MTVKAVILVGGETTGTRFRPLTMDIPKVLFPIAGKPLVSHIIDSLVNQLDDNFHEVFLISFFRDPAIFETYAHHVEKVHPKLKVTVLTEPYPLGTAGGLYYFRDKISAGIDSKILLIHGDVICNYQFKEIVDFSNKTNSDAVLLGIDPKVLVGQDGKNSEFYDREHIFAQYGTIIANKETAKVVHYIEKPKSDSFAQFQEKTYNITINGGVYVFSNKIFDLLAKAKEVKTEKQTEVFDDLDNDSQNENILSFELDVFKTLPSHKDINFFTFKSNSFWYQLKTPIFALLANGFFLNQKDQDHLLPPLVNVLGPVKVLDTDLSHSKNYKFGPDVSIGNNVKIGDGVRLRNCIISDDVVIEDHSIIVNAIISKGVKIGKWCRVEGTINLPVVNKDISQFTSDNYLKLINNIVVLCKGTSVGNQVFVYNSIVLPHKELKSDVKYEIVM